MNINRGSPGPSMCHHSPTLSSPHKHLYGLTLCGTRDDVALDQIVERMASACQANLVSSDQDTPWLHDPTWWPLPQKSYRWRDKMYPQPRPQLVLFARDGHIPKLDRDFIGCLSRQVPTRGAGSLAGTERGQGEGLVLCVMLGIMAVLGFRALLDTRLRYARHGFNTSDETLSLRPRQARRNYHAVRAHA